MSGSLISKAGGLRIGSVCKFSLHPEECSTKYRMGQNRKKILRKILAAEITKTIIALYLYIYCSCRITKYRYWVEIKRLLLAILARGVQYYIWPNLAVCFSMCSELCNTPNFSPAATLLRKKRRKRELTTSDTEQAHTEPRASPPLPRCVPTPPPPHTHTHWYARSKFTDVWEWKPGRGGGGVRERMCTSANLCSVFSEERPHPEPDAASYRVRRRPPGALVRLRLTAPPRVPPPAVRRAMVMRSQWWRQLATW